jgi:DNA-binding MarR family transcriptional regulator
MDKREDWELARQIMQCFMAHYVDPMDSAAISMGLEPSNGFLVIIPAYLFEPDPISANRLRKKNPYNSPTYYEEPLLAVKNAGFLDEAPEGGYILNQRGHEAFRKIMDAAYQQMERLFPLPPMKIDELKLLLSKLVQASILSPEHICKWSILHSRRLDPGRNVAPIITIDQYLSDLSSYRDDAHLTSWLSHSIDAHAWDILGVLWQGMASSTADVIDLIDKRRWTEGETRKAINELIRKGWIINGEQLTLTEEGRQVRDNAEELTNKFFFLPWHVLTDIEYKQLCDLLTQLKENLEKPKAK